MKLPTITILAAAATFFSASLANADPASRRGHSAYGSAVSVTDAWPKELEPDGSRASTLRTCNKAVENMIEGIWGVERSAIYRACMATYGQME